jgi:uncharacterized protein YgbK (DUF1537 family)
MRRLAIIADDLTSATDCGIHVTRRGVDILVILGEYKSNPYTQRASAVSVDTDTRSTSVNEAYSTVKEVALRIQADGYENVYKSVDSTLRGNIGVEIDAVMDVYDFDFSVVAPAFPHYGRKTVNGRQFLKGVPLTQTEFASDPKNPVKEDNIVKLISSQSKRKVGLVKLDTLRRGLTTVSEEIALLRDKDVEIIVFDAQVEEDLNKIVHVISKMNHRVLWVGSTGLSRYVPKLLTYAHSKARNEKTTRIPSSSINPSMLVSGSTSETTKRQLGILTQFGIFAVEMNPFEIISGDRAENEFERCRSLLVDALKKGNDVALHVPTSRKNVAITMLKGQEMKLNETEVTMKILDALAEITKRVVESFKPCGLILTGGDTAKRVCEQLGGIAIKLLEEIEPGIPMGYLFGGTELLVITKAGDFGTPYAFANAIKALKRRTRYSFNDRADGMQKWIR